MLKYISLFLAAFFTAGIMVIVRMHQFEVPLYNLPWWPFQTGSSMSTDFFNYFKMIATLTTSILASIVILIQVMQGKLTIRKSFAYIPMGVYSLFVLISFISSDYKEFALWGNTFSFEGTLALLSYMLMLFCIINIADSEKAVKWIIYTVAFVGGVLCWIGMTQSMGIDFFQTALGKHLITPISFWSNLNNLNFTFLRREIYQTVYSPMLVGFYLTMLIPIFSMLFIHEKEKYKRGIWGILVFLFTFNLAGACVSGVYIGATSWGSMIGLLVSVIVGLLLFRQKLSHLKKRFGLLAIIAIIGSSITISLLANSYAYIQNNAAVDPLTTTKSDYTASLEKNITAPYVGFENNQDWFEGRGYIWSRTLPMLKDTLIRGHGADTYMLYFPQNDYVAKSKTQSFGKNPNIIVDKPFNLYMQIAVETGGISLLALVALWGMYIVQSFKIYRHCDFNDFLPIVGAGIFLGVCGFMVAGIFIDSSINIMPIFYGLLGTGIAVNRSVS